MAILYKISKEPTIYEETPQGYSPILGEQAFKEKGFSFGDVKEITPQEWATMRLSKGMTTPIGSEYVKTPYAPDVYKAVGGELQPIKSAAEYQTLTGGTDWSKVATISPELFSQYKLGLPIGEMEATGIATGQMAETIKSATQLPQIEAQQKGLGATILEKIKGLPALLTGKKKEVLEEKGVTSKEAQVSSYDKQIASLSTLYEKAINELRAKPISASIIQGREALYVRQEAIEIKGLTALREIVAGDVDRAYKLANEAVSEATKLEQAEINALIEERNQLASQATAESQKYTLMLNNAIKQREDRLAKEEKVNDQKVELMLKYPQAGISPTDTFDSALEKARKEGARQEVLTETKTPKAELLNQTQIIKQTGKQGGSRNWRNNNPGNIEYGEFAKSMGAIGTDGRFAVFPDEATGEQAMKALLLSANYRNLSLDAALKRWSGGGYGIEAMPTNLQESIMVGRLSEKELNQVMGAMRKREGWFEGEAAPKKIVGKVGENKSNAALLQNVINSASDPITKYVEVIADPDVPAEVKQYLKRPSPKKIYEEKAYQEFKEEQEKLKELPWWKKIFRKITD